MTSVSSFAPGWMTKASHCVSFPTNVLTCSFHPSVEPWTYIAAVRFQRGCLWHVCVCVCVCVCVRVCVCICVCNLCLHLCLDQANMEKVWWALSMKPLTRICVMSWGVIKAVCDVLSRHRRSCLFLFNQKVQEELEALWAQMVNDKSAFCKSQHSFCFCLCTKSFDWPFLCVLLILPFCLFFTLVKGSDSWHARKQTEACRFRRCAFLSNWTRHVAWGRWLQIHADLLVLQITVGLLVCLSGLSFVPERLFRNQKLEQELLWHLKTLKLSGCFVRQSSKPVCWGLPLKSDHPVTRTLEKW